MDGSQEAPTSARAKHPPKESQALSPFRFRSLFFLFYISFIPSKALRGGGGGNNSIRKYKCRTTAHAHICGRVFVGIFPFLGTGAIVRGYLLGRDDMELPTAPTSKNFWVQRDTYSSSDNLFGSNQAPEGRSPSFGMNWSGTSYTFCSGRLISRQSHNRQNVILDS